MPAETLKCPNCGAPLDYDGKGAPTIRCPYCHSSVVVPKSLRPETPKPPQVIIEHIVDHTQTPPVTEAEPASGGKTTAAVLILALIGIIVIVFGTINLLTSNTDATNQILSMQTGGEATTAEPTPTPTDTPEPSPTPAFMHPTLSFGEAGTGPGKFSDARYIATDHQGNFYIADYQGGRIQVFDARGKYLRQWRVGDEKTIIYGLAADRDGMVYAAFKGDIVRYAGSTGAEQARLTPPNGGEYGDITIGPDGSLYAMWYESRWGMITSLEGHREDLVMFSPAGQPVMTLKGVISTQTEMLAFHVSLAVDGLGNIFALNDGEVFQFTPQGKYVNRWSQEGSAEAIAIDGQGLIYTIGNDGIRISDANGRIQNAFPTQNRPDMLLVDDDDTVWAVSRESVTKYEK